MESSRICVLDAGPIIHLDEIDALDLLFALGEVFAPESVAYEAERHRPGVAEKLGSRIVADAIPGGRDLYDLVRNLELGFGETAALSWAEQFGADLFVSDDDAARRAATVLGYSSTGTLGVITHAADSGIIAIPRAIELLRMLQTESTLFVRPALLKKVIATLR